jgi:hypothetical protein
VLLGDPRAYCDAEVLSWSYQEQGGKLQLIDSRVLLNCCGDHAITLAREGTGFLLNERDAPKDGTRCRCECVFDFRLDAEGVPGGTLPLRVVREITDDEADPVTLFDGALDLSIGAGTEVLDETDASAYCGTP